MQKLVKESITTYEKMLTKEIKRDKNKLWVNIDKLRNKCGMNSEAVQLYSEEGLLLGTEESKKELVNYWKTVYTRHENLREKEWNTEKEREYRMSIEAEKGKITMDDYYTIPENLREHYDLALDIKWNIKPMKEPKIDKNKVKKCLKRLKVGKSEGPDGLKPENYKAMLKSEVFRGIGKWL